MHRWLEGFTKLWAWVEIAAAPALAGAVAGVLCWAAVPGWAGTALGAGAGLLGLGLGVWAAERVRRRTDPREFVARLGR